MKRIIYIILFILFISTSLYAGSQIISATDASVIATRARYILNDPTTWGGVQKSIWSDAELLQWVNEGTLDIATRTQCLEDTEAETLVANTHTYALSNSFIAIKAVIYKDSNGVEWSLQRGNLFGEDSKLSFGFADKKTGYPGYWMQWGNSVIVYPIPDSTAAGDTITAYLVKRPSTVTATDDVLVPAQYDRALVLYVAIQGLYKDGKFNKASKLLVDYQSELDRYRSDYVDLLPKSVEGK